MRHKSETEFYWNAAVASLSLGAILAVIAAPLWRFTF